MAFEPQQGGQNLPLDPSQEPKLNVPPAPPTPPSQPTVQPITPIQEPTPPAPISPAPAAAPTSFENRVAASSLGSSASTKPKFEAEEPIFTPGAAGADTPVDELIATHRKKSRIMWLIGAVITIVVFVLIGFFVMRPKTEVPVVIDTPIETPTETETPATTHTSAFTTAPASTIAATVSAAPTREEILAVFVTEGQRAGLGVTEITFSDPDKNQLSSAAFLKALIPTVVGAPETVFESDFTTFIFKDANGVWPGYVLTRKADVLAGTVTEWTLSIEGSTLKDFFVVDPGAFKGWKSGTVNNIPDRFNAGTTAGASLAHLTVNTTTLIATSFEGMKQALTLLGF